MREQHGTFDKRLVDAGQWVEPGVRVEYSPVEHDPRKLTLEQAVLGSYEVLGCDRVEADNHCWLDVQHCRLARC